MNPQAKVFISRLSLFLLMGGGFSVYAADPSPPDAGLLMRENRVAPLPPKQQAQPEVESPAQVKPQMQPQNNLHVTVKKFLFSGNTQFSSLELEALLNSYTGHEIGFNDLQAAAEIISKHYRSAGFFLASAYLPQQSIKQGQVEIAILEGQLDNRHLTADTIQAIGELRLNKAVLQAFLDSHAENEIVTEAEMNRLSLLINDLPGIESKVVLAPGSRTGTSSLSLKVREEPLLKGYLSADNHGLYSTGYYRFDAGISLNDLTGYGDQLNLRAQSTESGGTVSGWADYSVPINGYGTRFAINLSELHYSLGRSFKSLNAHGIARTVGTSLIHPFWLSRNGRLTGTAHYEHRWMQDKAGSFSDTDRELNVMSFSFSGNLYDQLFNLSGMTQAYINVSAGEVSFNNKTAFDSDQRPGSIKSNGGYHKFAWQLSRTQNIIEDFSLFANFQGQVGSKNLDTSEQISLGGPNAIRAYPVGEGSADEGWLFNGEARYHIPNPSNVPGYLQFIGFIDAGFSRVNANPLPNDMHNSRHLAGYGFGINWLEVSGFNLHTSIAWRDTKKLPLSDSSADGPMMYFQLSKSL